MTTGGNCVRGHAPSRGRPFCASNNGFVANRKTISISASNFLSYPSAPGALGHKEAFLSQPEHSRCEAAVKGDRREPR